MFLGLCSFFGVTAKIGTAWRLGLANTFVLIITAVSAWILNTYILTHTPYLRTIAFIVVIASAVQIVEMGVKKYLPVLFRHLGIYPSWRNSTGRYFFTPISTICTADAITTMKAIVRRYGV